MHMQEYEFVGIGDITTDAFIRLVDADTHVNHGTQELCMRFGDKIPYESVEIVRAVGNSPNATVAAARLGLRTALVTNVGADENGKECIDELKKNNVSERFVQIQNGKATNYHYVLWYQSERTILIKHEKFDYFLPDIGNPKLLYLSSLGEQSRNFHAEIAVYLKTHPDVLLAFQPGTFQMKIGYGALKEIYMRTYVFFCNKEEAQRILGITSPDIVSLLKAMHERGPKIVCITDGPRGAHAYDGEHIWQMPMYPDPKPPLERTGAGDAFSSTVAAALMKGKSLPEALSWGPINSMSVVQYVGAQAGLLHEDALQKYLATAPGNYRAKKIG